MQSTMEESSSNGGVYGNNTTRFLNSSLLNFQKMELELKCPLCFNFFHEPVLLPCNHLFCKGCMSFEVQIGSRSVCPICKTRFVDRDMRPASFMDKMVSIYRNLDATFSTNMPKLVSSGIGVALEQSHFSQSVPFAASNCKEFEGFSMPVDCKFDNLSIEGRKRSCERHEDCRMPHESRVDQLSAGSPPPFGDGKVSDDSSDDYHGHGFKSASDRISIITNTGENKLQLSPCMSSALEEKGHLRGLKRQKLDYGPLKSGISGADHIHPPVSELGNSQTSNSEIEHKSLVTIASNMQPFADADNAIVRNAKCAFCQSSQVTVDTGPILHYMNGTLVVGVEAANPNVIHVHKLCVDWTPQVYYQDGVIQNLKAEVARGSKLKCHKCGVKGAALGCYLKSCQKSYHVPCALGIEGCRWDMVNFLLLCSSHSSTKFPDERSKPRNQQDSSNCKPSPDGVKNWIFCPSALSAGERIILVKFANIFGAAVSKIWKPDVTHLIASIDENRACTRTYKVLMGMLNGVWILNMDWVKACMKEKRLLCEEAYEIALDNYGRIDGPKSGRLRVLYKAPKLFTGLSFYFTDGFSSAFEEDLQDLVIAGGGRIMEKEEEEAAPSRSNDPGAAPKVLVVYNLDCPEGCNVEDGVSILWQRLNEAEEIAAAKIGGQVIGHSWLLESIASGNLQPFFSC